jgi:hypothetical protein
MEDVLNFIHLYQLTVNAVLSYLWLMTLLIVFCDPEQVIVGNISLDISTFLQLIPDIDMVNLTAFFVVTFL